MFLTLFPLHGNRKTPPDTTGLQLYDHLLAMTPGPVVALNRAVAVAEIEGAQAALALIDRLPLAGHYLFHAIRADLLGRMGRTDDAALAYAEAIARTDNTRERGFLRAAADELG